MAPLAAPPLSSLQAGGRGRRTASANHAITPAQTRCRRSSRGEPLGGEQRQPQRAGTAGTLLLHGCKCAAPDRLARGCARQRGETSQQQVFGAAAWLAPACRPVQGCWRLREPLARLIEGTCWAQSREFGLENGVNVMPDYHAGRAGNSLAGGLHITADGAASTSKVAAWSTQLHPVCWRGGPPAGLHHPACHTAGVREVWPRSLVPRWGSAAASGGRTDQNLGDQTADVGKIGGQGSRSAAGWRKKVVANARKRFKMSLTMCMTSPRLCGWCPAGAAGTSHSGPTAGRPR